MTPEARAAMLAWLLDGAILRLYVAGGTDYPAEAGYAPHRLTPRGPWNRATLRHERELSARCRASVSLRGESYTRHVRAWGVGARATVALRHDYCDRLAELLAEDEDLILRGLL